MNTDTAQIRDSLGNVAAISAGYPFRGTVDELQHGDVAVVQMRNVDAETGVNWDDVQRIALPSKRAPSLLATGDIIFTTRGSRNYALALGEIPGQAVCSPHFFVIRSHDPNRIVPAFLAWQVNQRPAQEYLQREATGSHILNIRREVIENLPVTIPPVAIQHIVIAFAETARAERAALTRLIDNRNQQLEAIALGLVTPERHHA